MAGTPLGCIPLDSAQTIRKTYVDCLQAHRVTSVNVDFNIKDHDYDDCGKLISVKYYHESDAESTKVTVVADVGSSLNGKSFNVFSKDSETRYNILYSVNCATSKPASTASISYILVNLIANDVACVVAKATQLAIEADTSANADFCIVYAGKTVTITNKVKGDASDVIDSCTSFSFCILQQGIKELVETLTYTYTADGKVDTIISSSGSNLLNVVDPVDPSVVISGGGNITRVTENGELAIELAPLQNELLEDILTEMRIMNVHLSLVTDTDIKKRDLDSEQT